MLSYFLKFKKIQKIKPRKFQTLLIETCFYQDVPCAIVKNQNLSKRAVQFDKLNKSESIKASGLLNQVGIRTTTWNKIRLFGDILFC